jgi:hypothetical protein
MTARGPAFRPRPGGVWAAPIGPALGAFFRARGRAGPGPYGPVAAATWAAPGASGGWGVKTWVSVTTRSTLASPGSMR